MSYYFENNEVESRLEELIEAICTCNNELIMKTILLYEKANLIFGIKNQIHNIIISEEILDVVTRQYSKFFFSELTHQSIEEYLDFHENFFKMIEQNIVNTKKNSICEIGSGLAKNAFFLIQHCEKIEKYYAIDNNALVVELNEVFFSHESIHYILSDIFKGKIVKNCDIIFMFHFLKHYPSNKGVNLLKQIYNEHLEIWIYDISKLIDDIECQMAGSIPSNRVSEYFLILGRH